MIDSAESEIRRQVEERLLADKRTKDAVIDVAYIAGQVSLTGKVHSPATKAAAEEIARSVPGVRLVDNELSIR